MGYKIGPRSSGVPLHRHARAATASGIPPDLPGHGRAIAREGTPPTSSSVSCRQTGAHREHRLSTRNAGVRFFAWLISTLTHSKLTDTSSGLRAMRAEMTGVVRQTQPQYQTSELLIGAVFNGYVGRRGPDHHAPAFRRANPRRAATSSTASATPACDHQDLVARDRRDHPQPPDRDRARSTRLGSPPPPVYPPPIPPPRPARRATPRPAGRPTADSSLVLGHPRAQAVDAPVRRQRVAQLALEDLARGPAGQLVVDEHHLRGHLEPGQALADVGLEALLVERLRPA